MSQRDVIIARIYLGEEKGLLQEVMNFLHDEHKLRGVTVFRGISGFGESGEVHTSNLLDVSLSLPVVVEFFDVPQKVAPLLEQLRKMAGNGHVVSWPAKMNIEE